MNLYAALWDALAGVGHVPRQPWNRFIPHLSVGQVRGREEMERLVGRLQVVWQAIRFKVTEFSLIWRNNPPDDVFRVGQSVLLDDVADGGSGNAVGRGN